MVQYIVAFLSFIIGTLLGSFYTLAVYRIPLKQDITHERSYCPKCNHKLNFWDLIPVFSYIFLGGKCRYCKEKIRPRYLILEIFSGIAFMFYIFSLNIDIYGIQIKDVIDIFIGIIYVSIFVITAGINIESKKIEKSILNFGIIISIIYVIYVYFLKTNLIAYIIYLVIIAILYLIGKNQNKYINLITYIIITLLYIGTKSMIIVSGLTLIVLAIENAISVAKKKEFNPPVAAIISIISICILILKNFIML